VDAPGGPSRVNEEVAGPPGGAPRTAASPGNTPRAPVPVVDALLGGYLLVGAAALAFPGRPPAWPAWMALHLAGALVLLAPPPVRRLRAELGARLGGLGRVLADWYPLLLVPAFYFDLSILNVAVHEGRYFDALVQDWDAALFGGQPSRDLALRWPWLPLSEVLHASYLSYYAIIYVPAIALYARGMRVAFREVVLAIMATFVVHYLFFIFLPVQGPRYLFDAPAGGLESGPVYRATHWLLGNASSRGTAFPSSHVAVATAISLTLMRFLPRIGLAALALTALLAVATVYGGFHYATDAWVGAAFGLAVAAALAASRPADSLDLEPMRSPPGANR
jgi:membrane-associated phospholipid phosphatase